MVPRDARRGAAHLSGAAGLADQVLQPGTATLDNERPQSSVNRLRAPRQYANAALLEESDRQAATQLRLAETVLLSNTVAWTAAWTDLTTGRLPSATKTTTRHDRHPRPGLALRGPSCNPFAHSSRLSSVAPGLSCRTLARLVNPPLMRSTTRQCRAAYSTTRPSPLSSRTTLAQTCQSSSSRARSSMSTLSTSFSPQMARAANSAPEERVASHETVVS